MKKLAVITSGGDAPGMNAAIRGAVLAALSRGAEIVGFEHGYRGVLQNEVVPLDVKAVAGIMARGGTILRTARCKEFMEPSGRVEAISVFKKNGVEGAIIIGGDGSLTGARKLHEEFGFPVVGIPGSIDNDIPGTDFSIGFDTAVNTAVEAIDRVRDTAYSHERVFVIEVMGRHNGFIALEAGLSVGAEAVIIPEVTYSLTEVCDNLKSLSERGRKSSIIIVAEGAARASDIKEFVQSHTGFETRYLVLGHMQRGGNPSAFDRVLGLRLSHFATHRILSGYSGDMVGVDGNKLVAHPLSYVLSSSRTVDPDRLLLVDVMSR